MAGGCVQCSHGMTGLSGRGRGYGVHDLHRAREVPGSCGGAVGSQDDRDDYSGGDTSTICGGVFLFCYHPHPLIIFPPPPPPPHTHTLPSPSRLYWLHPKILKQSCLPAFNMKITKHKGSRTKCPSNIR